MAAQEEAGDWDVQQKLVLLGETGTGKSSLLVRFVSGHMFDPATHSTIGADFRIARVAADDGTAVRLQVWDPAGAERLRPEYVAAAFYRCTDAALVVFDVADRHSFERVPAWMGALQTRAPPHLQVVLVGTKADLKGQRKVTPAEAHQLAIRFGAPYLECSAKTGKGCALPFSTAATSVLRACQDGLLEPKTRQQLEQAAAGRACVCDHQAEKRRSGSRC